MTTVSDRATFTDMAASTQQDWQIIAGHQANYMVDLPSRLLDH